MKTFSMTAATLGLLAGNVAFAQNISALNPQDVMQAMQEEGYLATMETDNVGDPKIASKVSSSNFSVFFYGCNNGVECTTLQFSSGYDIDGAISPSRINDWNREKRFGAAYVDDEGDPFLQMDIVAEGEGVSRAAFAYQIDLWRELIEDFEDFIDW